MRALALILAFLGGPVAAATVLQEIDYNFTTGPLSGTTVEVRYSYPTLPPGQALETYSPSSIATASYLGAVGQAPATLIFSGGVDILTPEPYISFSFDPSLNSSGLMNIEVWNVSSMGIYFEGDPDIQTYSCSGDVDCVFRTAVIPLPAAGWLLLGAILGATGLSRAKRRAAAVRQMHCDTARGVATPGCKRQVSQ